MGMLRLRPVGSELPFGRGFMGADISFLLLFQISAHE
jgi:hypothetical protein